MQNNTNPWANSSQLLFQQLSSAAVAASQRSHQSSTLPQQAQQQQQQQQNHHHHQAGQQQSTFNVQGNSAANTSANGQDQLGNGGPDNNPLGPTPSHMRMLQQQGGAHSWRSPFLLDPSIPAGSNSIKQEQIHYGYPSTAPNNVASSTGLSNYHNQMTSLAAANSVGSNSTAAAAAAAAAMFYPIELGDSSMFGRINVPFNSNSANLQAAAANSGSSLRQQQQRHNLSCHSINGKCF